MITKKEKYRWVNSSNNKLGKHVASVKNRRTIIEKNDWVRCIDNSICGCFIYERWSMKLLVYEKRSCFNWTVALFFLLPTKASIFFLLFLFSFFILLAIKTSIIFSARPKIKVDVTGQGSFSNKTEVCATPEDVFITQAQYVRSASLSLIIFFILWQRKSIL